MQVLEKKLGKNRRLATYLFKTNLLTEILWTKLIRVFAAVVEKSQQSYQEAFDIAKDKMQVSRRTWAWKLP